MKIYVAGYQGTVGSELIKRGCEPLECDITDREQTLEVVSQANPDVIINCAAITDVAWCEDHLKEALNVNGRGAGSLALSFNGMLIQISTDHVFNGKRGNYSEKDKTDPVNVYGSTKLAGELLVGYGTCRPTIVRTSRLFTHKMLEQDINQLSLGENLIFTHRISRSFMYVPHFVDALLSYMNHYNEEIIHIAGTHIFTYAEFWTCVANIFGFNPNQILYRTSELKDATPRPFKGGLNISKARKLGIPLRSAQEGIEEVKRDFYDN